MVRKKRIRATTRRKTRKRQVRQRNAAASVTSAQTAASARVDDHVFLLGRPPVSEFLSFVKTMAVDGQTIDLGALTNDWRAANQHLTVLEASEAGFADNPRLIPLPATVQPVVDMVRNEPMFAKSYQFTPVSFATVELDRLVVFQKHINLGFIAQLRASLPPKPTEEDIARFAFGLDRQPQQPAVQQTAQNAYSFVSPSSDLRTLDSGILQPSQISGFQTTGRPAAFVVMAVGYGSNHLCALHVENRLILNNGSHRAYALREARITQTPCLIQHVAQRDELELVAAGDVPQHPDRYLKGARPPVLKDYFDPLLRTLVRVARKNRLVQVQLGHGTGDIPAA